MWLSTPSTNCIIEALTGASLGISYPSDNLWGMLKWYRVIFEGMSAPFPLLLRFPLVKLFTLSFWNQVICSICMSSQKVVWWLFFFNGCCLKLSIKTFVDNCFVGNIWAQIWSEGVVCVVSDLKIFTWRYYRLNNKSIPVTLWREWDCDDNSY